MILHSSDRCKQYFHGIQNPFSNLEGISLLIALFKALLCSKFFLCYAFSIYRFLTCLIDTTFRKRQNNV